MMMLYRAFSYTISTTLRKKGEKKVKQKADHVKKNKRIILREDAKIAKKKFDTYIILNFLIVQFII